MQTRTKKVECLLNEREHAHLENQVRKTNLSRAALLRSLIMGYRPKEPPPLEYYDLLKELRTIGRNINQIRARANATGFFMTEEYSQNAKQLFKMILSIQEAVTAPEKVR